MKAFTIIFFVLAALMALISASPVDNKLDQAKIRFLFGEDSSSSSSSSSEEEHHHHHYHQQPPPKCPTPTTTEKPNL